MAAVRGLPVDEAIAAANTQPYSHIHRPGIGVGGHCIPVYPYFLISDDPAGDLTVPRAARQANDAMVPWALARLATALGGLAGRRVLVLGYSYRENVKETAFSAAKPLIRELRRRGPRPCSATPSIPLTNWRPAAQPRRTWPPSRRWMGWWCRPTTIISPGLDWAGLAAGGLPGRLRWAERAGRGSPGDDPGGGDGLPRHRAVGDARRDTEGTEKNDLCALRVSWCIRSGADRDLGRRVRGHFLDHRFAAATEASITAPRGGGRPRFARHRDAGEGREVAGHPVLAAARGRATLRHAGICCLQMSCASQQRVWKRQPVGGLSGLGTSPFEHDALAAVARVGHGDGRQQRLGVGVLRVLEQRVAVGQSRPSCPGTSRPRGRRCARPRSGCGR